MVVGWLAGVVIPMFAPGAAAAPPSMGSGGSMVALLIVVYFLARLRGAKRPWISVVLAIVGLFLISAAGGYFRGSNRRDTAEDAFLDSIDRFEPASGAHLRAIRSDPVAFEKAFQPVLSRAVLKAPDSDVIALATVQEEMVSPKSEDVSLCAGAARGSIASATAVSNEMQFKVMREETELLNAPAGNTQTPAAPDEETVSSLLEPIYKSVYPADVLADPPKLAKLPDKMQCQMYLKMMGEIQALSPEDASTIIRYLMGARSRH